MTPPPKILLVEDDEGMRETCRQALERAPYTVLGAASPVEAEPILLREELDLVVTDLRMPHGGGQEVLRAAHRVSPGLPVILITAYPSVESAVEAFKGGVVDYLTKPFTGDQLLDAVGSALRASHARDRADLLRRTNPTDSLLPEWIGDSPAMRALMAEVRRLATVEGNVLILGEIGSGRRMAARALHRFSRRSPVPLVEVTCTGTDTPPFEPEPFRLLRRVALRKGDVTPGLFEQAEGGGLFLAEVGDLSVEAQANLLLAMERVTPRKADVRVLASTSRDLSHEVRTGRFREDTLRRLRQIELPVPPLRERTDDIPRLALHFLDRFAKENSKIPVEAFTDDALSLLVEHPWPGNVDELRNTVLKAVAHATGSFISAEDLRRGAGLATPSQAQRKTPHPREAVLGHYEKSYLVRMLEQNGSNITHTARALGIHRTTLQRLVKRYGIPTPSRE
ncbi:MAG: sigma-54-dependent Fis family transcriptional regulator [Nitrospirae bacterium]|nr:sigma-54-dependent Fis family transcriptional regulator [Nitrospirota bacterium]